MPKPGSGIRTVRKEGGRECVNLEGTGCPHTLTGRQTLSSKKQGTCSEGISQHTSHPATTVRHSNSSVTVAVPQLSKTVNTL